MADQTGYPEQDLRRTQWCTSAAISDGKQLDGQRSQMHSHCPVAIRTTRPVRAKNGTPTGASINVLLVCSCQCHVTEPNQSTPQPRCLDCHNQTSGEVDKLRWLCLDNVLCSTRVQERVEADPTTKLIRAAQQDAARLRANKRARTARNGEDMSDTATAEKSPKVKAPPKPKVGVCAHCGEPTKGGQFVAGHDAKLKGMLQRLAIDSSAANPVRVEAIAEQIARGWHKGDYPDALITNIRGVGETDEAKAADQRTKREAAIASYVKLATAAEKMIGSDAAGFIARLTQQRIGK